MKYIDADKLIAEIEFAKSIYGNPKRVIHGVADAFRQDGRAAMCDDILKKIASLQQEQPVTKEPISHLEHWLAFFGCPEENIEKCATQIAQGYGAIRYLEGVQNGAEAVNELAKQEQPDFDDVDPKHLVHSHYTKVRETKTGRVFWAEYSSEAAEWYEAGTGKAYSISDVEIVKEQPEVDLEKLKNKAELIANEIMIGVQANKYHTCIYNKASNDFNHSHLFRAALKGIEVGLKARKEESK